jgi:uncharacterized membrane protein YqhA
MSTVPTPLSPQVPVEFRLTHVAPVSTAAIASLLFSALSLLVIGVVKFFQFFDPTPPTRDPQGVMLLVAAWVATIAMCFVAVLLLCWLFNLLARFTGGIRYRSSRDQ